MQPSNEVKVLPVGAGSAGKTSLVKRLWQLSEGSLLKKLCKTFSNKNKNIKPACDRLLGLVIVQRLFS